MAFSHGAHAVPAVVRWAELADPTLFALPNARHGFSEGISQTLPAIYSPAPEATGDVALAPPLSIAMPTISPRLARPAVDEYLEALSTRHLTDSKLPPEAKTISSAPLWFWQGGVPLNSPPTFDPERLASEARKAPPLRETRIEIIYSAGRYRTRLLTPCGNPELDGMALAALGPVLSPQESAYNTNRQIFGRRLPDDGIAVWIEWGLAAREK